jgi:hypothetical protein
VQALDRVIDVGSRENLRPIPWKPGQSGNPNGYSRGRRTTDAILKLIAEKGAEEAIARVWLKALLEGDFRFFKEFLDRTEGKTPDTINIKTHDDLPPADPDIDAKAAAVLKELGIARATDTPLSTPTDDPPAGVPTD